MGVNDRDGQIRFVERHVIVAAVPHHHIGLFLRLSQDGFIVYPGVDDGAFDNMRFVFFHFFHGAVESVQILDGSVALDLLLDKVAVGHRMTDGHDTKPLAAEEAAHFA